MLLGHDKLDLVVDPYYCEKYHLLCVLIFNFFFLLFILFDEACLQILNSPK